MNEQKPVVFVDWFATLSNGKFWKGLGQEKYDVIQSMFQHPNTEFMDGWMRGSMNSEEACVELAEKLGLPVHAIFDELVKSCAEEVLSASARDALQKLRRTHRAVLVSDGMDCFRRFVVPALGLEEVFDQVVVSAEKKLLKRDNNGEIFEQLAKQHGVLVSDCHLVDDSEIVCGVFEKLGGKVHRPSSLEHTIQILTTEF